MEHRQDQKKKTVWMQKGQLVMGPVTSGESKSRDQSLISNGGGGQVRTLA